jgi:hypothetical protein
MAQPSRKEASVIDFARHHWPRSLAALALAGACAATQAAEFQYYLGDADGFGFNDNTATTPVGGNPGTTLGDQRFFLMLTAFDTWAGALDSAVPITVVLRSEALACGVIAATRANNFFVLNGAAPIVANTYYPQALAEKLVGTNALPLTSPENLSITVTLNANLGTAACPGSNVYLGTDGAVPAGAVNLLGSFTHELAHGLGFSSLTNAQTGVQPNGLPTIWDRFLFDNTQGKSWPQLSNAQRAASAVNWRNVTWRGPNVTNDLRAVLEKGSPELKVIASGLSGFNPELNIARFGADIGNYSSYLANLTRIVDQSNGTGLACSALTGANRNNANGRLVLIDRGTCDFTVKVKNAQNAGAMGVIVVNNGPGAPFEMSGVDPSITIPAVMVSQADGARLKSAVPNPAAGPYTTLRTNPFRYFGADRAGYALIYTPYDFQGGSTLTHFDVNARPNLLMEPIDNGAGDPRSPLPPVDLSVSALRDLGW